jgi:hypothetical protein
VRKHDKLWVFVTKDELEVYAPTLWEAEREASDIAKDTGLEFTLHQDWERYQEAREQLLRYPVAGRVT